MLDFKELPQDGVQFELLMRELLFTKGLDVYWSGVGADGGRDLLCAERIDSVFGPTTRRWLVQCKHFAHSGRSVGIPDLDNVIDSSRQHSADGYALASSTYVSSAVIARLESIGADKSNHLTTSYFDSALIERALLTPQCFHIAQRFFPIAAISNEWKVNFTDRPNHFVVSYRGYLFHLMNRIGSEFEYHFKTIQNRIADIEKIPFNEGHFIRPRAFWYDDKNGGYSVYLDYMVPQGHARQYRESSLKNGLGHHSVLEDGQVYNFDIMTRKYVITSDHYDQDHYSYYVPYMGSFLVGEGRSRDTRPSSEITWNFMDEEDYENEDSEPILDDNRIVDAGASRAFEKFVGAIKAKMGDDLLRAHNANPEGLALIKDGSLSKLYEIQGHMAENFTTARFLFKARRKERVFKLIELMDQGFDCSIRCSEGLTFLPGENERAVRAFDKPRERLLFVDFNVTFEETSSAIRESLNRFFVAMAERIEAADL